MIFNIALVLLIKPWFCSVDEFQTKECIADATDEQYSIVAGDKPVTEFADYFL